jgi:cathepsin B
MTYFMTFFLLLSLALCQKITKPNYFNSHINQEMIDAIKASGAQWETIPPEKNPLRHYSDEQIKGITTMPGFDYPAYHKKMQATQESLKQMHKLTSTNNTGGSGRGDIPAKSTTMPTTFNWSASSYGQRCSPTVLNQGTCGGCYAFAAAESFSARICQATGRSYVDYSPQDIIACNSLTSCCNGGVVNYAFEYLENYGILPLSCIPYGEANNGASATTPIQACSPKTCIGSGSFTKGFCQRGTSLVLMGTANIQWEIYQRGPVATLMNVYSDFMSYASGIYRQSSGSNQGPHAIVLLGWGATGTQNWWWVQNSWGTSWGQNGYLQIDMLDANSAIAQYAYYCLPATS